MLFCSQDPLQLAVYCAHQRQRKPLAQQRFVFVPVVGVTDNAEDLDVRHEPLPEDPSRYDFQSVRFIAKNMLRHG